MTTTDPIYIIGLDLGQSADFSAMVVNDRRLQPTGVQVPTGESELVIYPDQQSEIRPITTEAMEPHYGIRHIERFKLGTSYIAVAARLRDLIKALPSKPILAIDYTGVGQAVLDIIVYAQLGIPIVAVQIATSQMKDATRDKMRPWKWTVPKRDLVAVMHVLLQTDRFRVADGVPDRELLREEMRSFRMKITDSANLQFGEWRDGQHDDLVLATALSCWAGERAIARGGLL